ncbi:La- protein 4B [Actinomortierella ambigua]|nr:La- protein 4B [Actinomortierella ambigua]
MPRNNIGLGDPRRVADSAYEQQPQILYGANNNNNNNNRPFGYGHGQNPVHTYENNTFPHRESQIVSRGAVWGGSAPMRSPDQAGSPTHLYSVRPSGPSSSSTRSPRQDYNTHGSSPHLTPHPGGMAAYHVNDEAALGANGAQYGVPYASPDQLQYHGHASGHQHPVAKRFIKTQLPAGSVAMYPSPAFTPHSSTTVPNAASAYPHNLKPVPPPMASMGQYPPPWGYISFGPSPPPPSVLLSPPGHMITFQDSPSRRREGHHPVSADDQEDVEVVLGNPDRASETESTVSSSSGAKGAEATSGGEVSHMDEKQFLPISVIADFKMVRALTNETSEIVEALRRSSLVIVNEAGTMVKPNVVKRPRTTLILRDLSLDTTEDEIRQVFEIEGQCSPVTITKEVGNNWFVDFASEEKALAMLAFTRGKCIRDTPIAGRLKSTTTLAGLEKSSQDVIPEWSTGGFNDDTLIEGPQQYRRFPADENSHVPPTGYSVPPCVPYIPNGPAGSTGLVNPGPARRNNDMGFGAGAKGRRAEETRKQGRRGGQQQYHHQPQHHRRQAEGERNALGVEHRRNSFSDGSKQRPGRRHDRSEGLLTAEHVEPTGCLTEEGRGGGGGANFERRQRQEHAMPITTASSIVQTEPYVSVVGSVTTDDSMQAAASASYTPPHQRTSRNQGRQDYREQRMAKPGARQQPTPKRHEEPQDSSVAEELSTTAGDTSQSSSASAATAVDWAERDEYPSSSVGRLGNIISQMSIAGSHQAKKTDLPSAPKPSSDASQSDQAEGYSSQHSTPIPDSESPPLNPVPLSQVIAEGEQQSLTKAGSGWTAKGQQPKASQPKQSAEKVEKDQANEDGHPRHQEPKQQQQQQQRHPSGRRGRGRNGGGDSASLAVPSVFDEALFPPMSMAAPPSSTASRKGVSSSSSSSSSSKLSVGFSYASALKQPSQPCVTDTVETSGEINQG